MRKTQQGIGAKPYAKTEAERRNHLETDRGVLDSLTEQKQTSLDVEKLMEAIVENANMREALDRVVSNGGSAGVDGMEVEELEGYLLKEWDLIKEKLLTGQYKPNGIREVEIPKPGKKEKRKLGIPTVTDRMIQQAINQVLQEIFDEGFSENSYGFRPGRSAQQAVLKAQEYVKEGNRVVVDMDLEKFFDNVDHDILMQRVFRKVKDSRVIQLIRRYLQAGTMEGYRMVKRLKGTPQGGPLSPLLSNIMLDDLDKELERRGHKFCRYADDCNIYVKSERAGDRVLESVSVFLETKLKLKVNKKKSAVGYT